ncbi:MAG TPA: hypothetical protein VFR42_02805 [Candidatus Acidoferrum sp.]|nr:hypothetical protein [Candidatus Acidoferrum sp.]
MAKGTTIYIELLEEGTPCWRPVTAEHLDGDLYRIIGETPDDEVWPFVQGDVVKCRIRTFQSELPQLVAYEKARRESGGAGK